MGRGQQFKVLTISDLHFINQHVSIETITGIGTIQYEGAIDLVDLSRDNSNSNLKLNS